MGQLKHDTRTMEMRTEKFETQMGEVMNTFGQNQSIIWKNERSIKEGQKRVQVLQEKLAKSLLTSKLYTLKSHDMDERNRAQNMKELEREIERATKQVQDSEAEADKYLTTVNPFPAQRTEMRAG